MWANAEAMLARAGGKPIRVASKSVRCRALLEAILRRDERFAGLMTYTLPETLWLAEQGFEDLLLAYPTADAGALGELALRSAANPGGAPIVMVDCVEHLDAIESVLGAGAAPVRVCIDVDASWWALGGRIKVGAEALAGPHRRAGGRAGAGDRAAAADRARRADGLRGPDRRASATGRPGGACAAPRSASCSAARPPSWPSGGRRSSPRSASSPSCEIVNGGGTGSLELTGAEDAVTEVDRRLRLLRPRPLRPLQPLHASPPRPASRCRSSASPRREVATALGGGYLASGSGDAARLPVPVAAAGPRARPRGGRRRGADAAARRRRRRASRSATASTCATPRRASSASASTPSTWSKASEIVDVVPTYRGEGQAFL